MKKFSYFLVIVFSLFFIPNVSALENETFGTIVSEHGWFSSLNSSTSWIDMGYNYGSNGNFAFANPSGSFSYGTYGGIITQCNMSLLEGNYYSITYYFGSGVNGNYFWPFYSSATYKLGISNSKVSSYITLDFNPVGNNTDVQQQTYQDWIVNTFTLIFKANRTGTCLSTVIDAAGTQPSSDYTFFGYNLTNLGSNMSSSDISAALSDEFNNINNQFNILNSSVNQFQQEQQETNDKLDTTNQELGEMNDFLQDDTPASTDDIDMDSLGTVSGLLPEGPVDSLLNIPFTFLSVLTSSMGGVCVPITGTFVFDSTLSIPCFDSFYDEVPDYLMNFINLIPSGFILIMYFKHLYKKVERAVSLQTTTDDEWGVI